MRRPPASLGSLGLPRQVPPTLADGAPAGGARVWGVRTPPEAAEGLSAGIPDLPAPSGLNEKPQDWKENLPGAMRRGSRRCPQRPGLPLCGVTARSGGIRGRRWNPKVGIQFSSLEAGAENQTCSSSAPQRGGLACLGRGSVSKSVYTPRHWREPGVRPGHACLSSLSLWDGARRQATYLVSGVACGSRPVLVSVLLFGNRVKPPQQSPANVSKPHRSSNHTNVGCNWPWSAGLFYLSPEGFAQPAIDWGS